MSESKVELYYKNVMAEVVGDEHGITAEQFGQLELEVTQAIHDVNNARIDNKTPYRDLPYNSKYAESVKQAVAQFKDNCEILVVLGIGGSALGNIAMQTALNPYMYNLDEAQRKGCPRLFVLDNVDPSQLGSFIDWLGDKLDKTVINVVSKSGRTAETASQFLTIKQLFEEKLGTDSLKKHFMQIENTDEKNYELIF